MHLKYSEVELSNILKDNDNGEIVIWEWEGWGYSNIVVKKLEVMHGGIRNTLKDRSEEVQKQKGYQYGNLPVPNLNEA